MKRRLGIALLVLVVAMLATIPAAADEISARGVPGVVYVTSQHLYYDTYVTVSTLPFQGPFQPLVNHTTEFGPGQPGYLGGRWWVDTNGNGIMDPTDSYLLCPLLGPGRTSP